MADKVTQSKMTDALLRHLQHVSAVNLKPQKYERIKHRVNAPRVLGKKVWSLHVRSDVRILQLSSRPSELFRKHTHVDIEWDSTNDLVVIRPGTEFRIRWEGTTEGYYRMTLSCSHLLQQMECFPGSYLAYPYEDGVIACLETSELSKAVARKLREFYVQRIAKAASKMQREAYRNHRSKTVQQS